MQLGVNQNINYKGVTYHIQTEDGGRNNPVITTLLFKGGTILASRRTSYEDILKSDQLETVVKEIMAEQHKSILKDLKNTRHGKQAGAEPSAGKAAEAKTPAGAAPAAPAEAAPASSANTGGAPKEDKSLDDIILEHLSINKKGS